MFKPASDGKRHFLALRYIANVRFVYIGMNFHFGEVVSDRKQGWRLEGGGDGLAHIHVARNDNAIYRGANDGVVEIHRGLIQCGLGLR